MPTTKYIHAKSAPVNNQQKQYAQFEIKRAKNLNKSRYIKRQAHRNAFPVYPELSHHAKWMCIILAMTVIGSMASDVAAHTQHAVNTPNLQPKRVSYSFSNSNHKVNATEPSYFKHTNSSIRHSRSVSISQSSMPSLASRVTEEIPIAHQNQDLGYALSDYTYRDIAPSNSTERFFKQQVIQSVKLTRHNIGNVKIADFWGEGRILDRELITGFPDAYNINHQHQKISNGVHRGDRIPNRIPTVNYENVDIAKFVANDTFQYVTLMGAPVTPAAAKEMYRIVRKNNASRILLYAAKDDYICEMQVASQKDFIHMQYSSQYVTNLESKLQVPSLRPISPMVPINQVMNDFKKMLKTHNVESAAKILRDLERYSSAGYTRTNQIVRETKLYINEYANQAELTEAIIKQAGREQAEKITNLFFGPDREVSLRRNGYN